MKAVTLAAATLAVLSTPALAGGPTIVEPDPMPAAMAAPVEVHDWSGAYVGLSYGRTNNDLTLDSMPFDANDGTTTGFFAGYLMQRGNFVYGGELSVGNINDAGLTAAPTIEFTKSIDLKGRAGFAANKALFYGTLGFSKVNIDFGGLTEIDMDGMSYGVGVDYAVSKTLTVGLEYLARDIDGDLNIMALSLPSEANLDTLSLRLGLSF